MTVTPTTIPLLFSLLNDPSLPIRLATSGALIRIVAKGLKEPEDKLKLIKVLALDQVLNVLEEKTRNEQLSRGEDVDEGEETFRESLGRLLNALGFELTKLADDVRIPRIADYSNQLMDSLGQHWHRHSFRSIFLARKSLTSHATILG